MDDLSKTGARIPRPRETAGTIDMLTGIIEDEVSDQTRAKEKEKSKGAHLEVGRLGEKLACRYLWRQGFRIIERNFQGRRGEIDIIAEKEGCVHFVEVKTRSSKSLGAPEERVDKKKRALLREAALEYLEQFHDAPPAGHQFDVLAQVLDARERAVEQDHIEEAF